MAAAHRAQARSIMQNFLSCRKKATHGDLLPSRIQRDQSDVQTVQDTITSLFVYPFSESQLVVLSSGIVATEKIESDLLEAETKGEKQMKNFIEKHLVAQTIDFYEPITQLSLGTFSSLKKVKVKTYNKVTQYSAQSNIFGKILLIQQNRKINRQEIFFCPLGPIPWALAEANGELQKSSKAKIMHELEKGVTRVERVDAPIVPIFDRMALVCMVKCTGLTYNQFADDLLKLLVNKRCGSKWMDVVFDVCWENSLKNSDRGNHSTGQIQFNVITGSAKISQWGPFLSNNKSKSQLIRFLVSRWKSQCSTIGESKLYVSFDEEYICI